MHSRAAQLLPLEFHEAGFNAVYKIWHGDEYEPRPSRQAKIIKTEDEDKLGLDVSIGADIGDVALYAAFLSLRTGKTVEFDWSPGMPRFEIDNSIPEPEAGDEYLRDMANERFKQITGTGNLDEEQRLAIALMSRALERKYYGVLGKPEYLI